MLEQSFEFPFDDKEAYEIELLKCSNWNQSTKKVLVILQTIDSRDLRAKQMLGDRITMQCFKNALKYSRAVARTYKDGLSDVAYIVAPFNRKRHLHMKSGPRKQAEAEFAAHAHRLIAKVKPTHVLVSGDEAFHAMWPTVEHHTYKRGWVHNLKSGGLKLKVTSTLDFARLLEKEGEYANLLGFWCRHTANLLLGKNPHDLSHVKAEPRYIDTIEKFDKMMAVLRKANIISNDTETRDLSVNSNAIYTVQFATNLNPDVGYVLPLRHPMTPWNKEELKYIKRELKKFYAESDEDKTKELVTFNGMYDLRVVRREFKLPIIWHKVWEITAGEHLLDENIVELAGFNSKPGNLAAVYGSYGNDFYYTASFSKADRGTTGNVKPNDKNFLMYAATDVVSLMYMRLEQIKRASHQEIEGRNYKPYFVRHMLYQMDDTAHVLSHLREDGSLIDAKYLAHLTSLDSPLRTEMRKLSDSFRQFPEAVEANSRVLGSVGLKAKGLWGKAKSAVANWGLSLSKPNHLRTLFFDVCGFEPVNKTKEGESSVDKAFVAANKDKFPIVAVYGEYSKLAKLLSTYAKGWLKKLRSNRDSIEDHHLRPDYSFFDVATGRLASRNPSLQTIPSRGKLVKIIKRMFPTRKGCLLVRFDYSAHEVRVWSYVGMDKILASVFKVGQKLRQAFIQNPTDENKKAIKEKGDIHILNVKRFFNKIVDKDHPLRDAIKAVIFGTIYGKSAETLGEDTKQGDKATLMEKIGNPDTPKDEAKKAERDLKDLMEEDRTPYAQGIIDKLFSEFKKAGGWTNRMKKLAEEKYYVYSPIGRIRHLYAAMTGDKKIVAQQVRRGANAPIQGWASEIGVKAARLVMKRYYKELPKICELLDIEYDPWKLRVPFNRMVHDASYFTVVYSMIIPFIHILQWSTTYGVTELYKEEFNIEFPVEPEIEIELGARDDQTHKWDWSLPNLVDSVIKSVDEAAEMGLLEGSRDDVLREIFRPWTNKKLRARLQKRYPLLGVTDLDTQITEAIRPIYVSKKDKKCKKEAVTS